MFKLLAIFAILAVTVSAFLDVGHLVGGVVGAADDVLDSATEGLNGAVAAVGGVAHSVTGIVDGAVNFGDELIDTASGIAGQAVNQVGGLTDNSVLQLDHSMELLEI